MVRVYRGELRLQEASYAFYQIPAGTADNVLIRRQVPLPQDTQHPSCRKLALQRLALTKAAKDWSHLTYRQKQAWKQRYEYI